MSRVGQESADKSDKEDALNLKSLNRSNARKKIFVEKTKSQLRDIILNQMAFFLKTRELEHPMITDVFVVDAICLKSIIINIWVKK